MSQALAITNNDLILSGPTGSLDSYIQAVSAVPVLSKEEEQELAHCLIDQNDLEAARSLVVSQLRFVVHIARGYSGYGLPLGDLIQEGNVGLMKAVKRFDPNVGVRLVYGEQERETFSPASLRSAFVSGPPSGANPWPSCCSR